MNGPPILAAAVALVVSGAAACPPADAPPPRLPQEVSVEAPSEVRPPEIPCTAPEADIALDHVIVAVRDLARAEWTFRAAGFTLKPGRLHPNGLLNTHAKLRDSTEIELMSLASEATDGIARGYRDFLEGGEGGAFVAFRSVRGNAVRATREAGLRADSLAGAYAVFPDLPSVFVLLAHAFVADPDSLLTHRNGAAGLREVWTEGGEELAALLEALGAGSCGQRAAPPGVEAGPGRAFGVANGAVVIIPPADPARRVVRGVVLDGPSVPLARLLPVDRHGVWVRIQQSGG